MDEKKCNEGCGHEHTHEHQTVTITFDNENEVECAILGVFEVENRNYIALVPVGDEEVLVYRYSEEDGEPALENIESDEEYEKVAEAFNAMVDEEEDDEEFEFEDETE